MRKGRIRTILGISCMLTAVLAITITSAALMHLPVKVGVLIGLFFIAVGVMLIGGMYLVASGREEE